MQAFGYSLNISAMQDENTFCIITEVCYGGDLEQLLKERGHLNETETAHVIHAALRVLEGCHKQGICYGDVKPANFLLKWPFPSIVDPQALPDIRVADFGSAQFIAPVSHHTLEYDKATCLEDLVFFSRAAVPTFCPRLCKPPTG